MKRVSIRWLRGQTEFMGEVRNDAVRKKKLKKKAVINFRKLKSEEHHAVKWCGKLTIIFLCESELFHKTSFTIMY